VEKEWALFQIPMSLSNEQSPLLAAIKEANGPVQPNSIKNRENPNGLQYAAKKLSSTLD